MFKFKRTMATAVDAVFFALLYFLSLWIFPLFDSYLYKLFNEKNLYFLIWLPMILHVAIPFLIMYLIEVILGFSIGKLIFNLRIKGSGAGRPHPGKLLIRSVVKSILIGTAVGAIASLISYITEEYVWYDILLGLDVVDSKKRSKDFYDMFRS